MLFFLPKFRCTVVQYLSVDIKLINGIIFIGVVTGDVEICLSLVFIIYQNISTAVTGCDPGVLNNFTLYALMTRLFALQNAIKQV